MEKNPSVMDIEGIVDRCVRLEQEMKDALSHIHVSPDNDDWLKDKSVNWAYMFRLDLLMIKKILSEALEKEIDDGWKSEKYDYD